MIVLLALAWAVVLVPSLIRPRVESSPEAGIRNFEQAMGVLANTRSDRQQHVPGRWVMVPKGMGGGVKTRRQRLIRKRRATFERLLIGAAATFVLGLLPPFRFLLLANVALDAIVIVYVFQLRRWHLNEMSRKRVVRDLPTEQTAPDADTAAHRPIPVLVDEDEEPVRRRAAR